MSLQLKMMQESRLATIEEIAAVHDADYVQQLKDTAENKAPTVVADFDDPDGFTYMTSTSFDDALKVITVANLSNHRSSPRCLHQLCNSVYPFLRCIEPDGTDQHGHLWQANLHIQHLRNIPGLVVCCGHMYCSKGTQAVGLVGLLAWHLRAVMWALLNVCAYVVPAGIRCSISPGRCCS